MSDAKLSNQVKTLIDQALVLIKQVDLKDEDKLCEAHKEMWRIYCLLLGKGIIEGDYDGLDNERDFDNYDIFEERLADNFQRKCQYFLWYIARKSLITTK